MLFDIFKSVYYVFLSDILSYFTMTFFGIYFDILYYYFFGDIFASDIYDIIFDIFCNTMNFLGIFLTYYDFFYDVFSTNYTMHFF